MSELLTIIREGRALRARGEPALLATVVAVRGSSYRRPGARMLVSQTRWIAGSISGGCLETDVAARGFWRTETVPALAVTYDARDEEDARIGAGCDGATVVLLERLGPPRPWDPIEALARCVEREQPAALATVHRTNRSDVPVGAHLVLEPGVGTVASFDDGATRAGLERAAREVLDKRASGAWTGEDGGIEALVEVLLPPPHLFVWGAGHDAVPVVALAKAVGWRVTVCAVHGRFSTRERFAGADGVAVLRPEEFRAEVDRAARPIAIVMSHAYEADREALLALVDSRAEHVGILGPRRRTERMLAELRERGAAIPSGLLGRLHAPAGLHIGAESPHEIALSIIAEAQATLAGAPAGKLRDRAGAIHAHDRAFRDAPQALVR